MELTPGMFIHHRTHGAGQVVNVEDLPDGRDARRSTGRVGVVFDRHTLCANPAYFWPQELQPVTQDNSATATHTGSHP